jgi:hypothetical protein
MKGRLGYALGAWHDNAVRSKHSGLTVVGFEVELFATYHLEISETKRSWLEMAMVSTNK